MNKIYEGEPMEDIGKIIMVVLGISLILIVGSIIKIIIDL